MPADVLIDLLTDSGHGRDVARPVGRDPARRRELRRLAVLVHVPRRGAGALPVPARDPDPPGPCGREDPLHRDRRARQGRPEQHALRHDAREHRVHGRGGGRPADPRGARARRTVHPFKGNMDLERARAAARERARRRGARGDGHDHEQLGRRPARLAREPARRARDSATATACRSSSTRAASPRTRGSSAQREPGQGDRCRRRHRPRDGLARRRHDDEREEGPARQHRRLARDERRRARRALPQPAHPHRGLPDLRRPRRAATSRRSPRG